MSKPTDSPNPFDEFESATSVDRPSRKRRRRWPWLVAMLGLVVLLLPNLIGWLGLQRSLVNYALSDFNGDLNVESLSLGWFQPIRLSNVSAVDAQGNPLLQIDQVHGTKTLLSLMFANDYGEFTIEQPVINAQLWSGGSNLEDAVAHYLNTPPESVDDDPSQLPKLTVNIVDGAVTVSSANTPQVWQLENLNAVVQTQDEAAPLRIDLQCQVSPAGGDTAQSGAPVGDLVVAALADAGANQLTFEMADVVLETRSFPVPVCAPLLERLMGPVQTAGQVTGKMHLAYDGRGQLATAEVESFDAANLSFVAQEVLGGDRIAVNVVSAEGSLRMSPSEVLADKFQVRSDFGYVNADGHFDINQLGSLASNVQLLDTPFQLDGKIDLARIIPMLPSTLSLRDDLVVNSGSLTFSANSRVESGNRRMVVNLDTANINARRGEVPIVWAKPLRLAGVLQQSQGRFSFDNVVCESEFLSIQGHGDLQSASFEARGDLAQLMARLGEFVDLQGTQLAGVLSGNFGWRAAPANPGGAASTSQPLQMGGDFVIANPMIAFADQPRWQPRQLSVNVDAIGRSGVGGVLQLDQGSAQLTIENETLAVWLAQPVNNVLEQSNWAAKCKAVGDVGGWLGHIANFVDLGDVNASGNLEVVCDATVTPESLELANIEYSAQSFAFDGYGMKIREPSVTGKGIAIYQLANGEIVVPELSVLASSAVAQAQQLKITFPNNMQVGGAVTFKADLNKVADWYELSPDQDSVFWFGAMEGNLQLLPNPNGIGGRLNSRTSNLVAAQQVDLPPAGQTGQVIQASRPTRGWQELWRESQLDISGELLLANDFDRVNLEGVRVGSEAINAAGGGSIADLGGAMTVDLAGAWNLNWEKINSVLTAYTGQALRFAGQGQQQFAVRGPLFGASPGQATAWVPPALQVYGDLDWSQADVLGIPVGGGRLEANVQQSVAYLKTTEMTIAGGKVQLSPQLDMRGENPVLAMGRGRLLDNVRVDPAMARQWLAYLTPLAADAASAQGTFSLDLEGLETPLFNPLETRARGSVGLADVVIGAGPVAKQLLDTIQQVRGLLRPEARNDRDLNTWLQLEQQSVPIDVHDRRIYHRQLKMTHKDFYVITSGSVGFDQSLDMVAEIPIADDWIAGKSYLSSLKGQSLKIPISGTVGQPKLNLRTVQQLASDIAKNAAGAAISDRLNPKINEYQNRFNNKIGNELNKLQGKLGEKLGGGLLPTQPQPPTGQQPTQPGQQNPPGPAIGNRLEKEILKGIGDLFKK